jgi:hypothetical protein
MRGAMQTGWEKRGEEEEKRWAGRESNRQRGGEGIEYIDWHVIHAMGLIFRPIACPREEVTWWRHDADISPAELVCEKLRWLSSPLSPLHSPRTAAFSSSLLLSLSLSANGSDNTEQSWTWSP